MIKRNTIQRTLVLQTVNQLKNHPTADTVYDVVCKEYPSISRGTVYRNLNQLVEEGFIQKIPVLGGAERFDHQTHNHYHFKCMACGNIYDLELDQVVNLDTIIQNAKEFQITGYDIMFKGLCSCCNEKNNTI